MKRQFARIEFVPHRSMQEQIRTHLRDLVVSGELAPGERLPSTHDLAKLWHTHLQTVQLALTPLVREGLLTRVNRVGTFVRQRERRLTSVGIYDTAAYGESLHLHAVHAALKDELNRAGIEMAVWIDPRPQTQRAQPWVPLVKAAEQHQVQALIVVGSDIPRLRWLQKLPVPIGVHGGLTAMPGRVRFDLLQMADLGLDALAKQGCRSVGVILPADPSDSNEDASRSVWLDFCEHFLEVARELGLTVKNEWMRLARHRQAFHGPSQESYGYEQFLELWRQPTRPEGLMVFPDTTVRGVILGLREKHVRVPGELKLVLHKNESVDLLCPMPATFVVSSERALARALIEQVRKQFRGERCEPVVLPLHRLAHDGRRS